MQGTKRAGRGVSQPMTNARGKLIAQRAQKMHAPTLVTVPQLAPWFRPDHLDVKHQGQQAQLKRALRDVGKLKGKMSLSMQVHGSKCPWSVVLWPRASDCADKDADDFMTAAVERRDEQCKCTPLIMYTGALA